MNIDLLREALYDLRKAFDRIGEAISMIDEWVDDNYDPTPYCSRCGAMERKNCDCGPIASNE